MPTYEYRCTECGRDLEAVQSFTDAALTECPRCHGALRKVYGNVGVVFKGSGFYRNDSRSTKAASDASDSKAEGKAESTSKDGSGKDKSSGDGSSKSSGGDSAGSSSGKSAASSSGSSSERPSGSSSRSAENKSATKSSPGSDSAA